MGYVGQNIRAQKVTLHSSGIEKQMNDVPLFISHRSNAYHRYARLK